MVATRGGLTLRDLNPHPEPGDSIVAVCCGGPLEVSGEVNAAVVAAPLVDAGGHQSLPRVVARPGARIRGGVFLGVGGEDDVGRAIRLRLARADEHRQA